MGLWSWFKRTLGRAPASAPSDEAHAPHSALPEQAQACVDAAIAAPTAIHAKPVFAGDIAQGLAQDIRGLMRHAEGNVERQFMSLLLRAVKNDGAELPAMPKEFLRIQRLLADPDVSLAKLAHAIQREPSIAAKFLAVTNSPYYAGRHRVVDVQQAIARLGLSTTQMLLTAILARSKVFRVPEHQAAAEALYTRALRSAAICQMLARLDGYDEQDAFIAGLFHDLGRVFVLTCAGRAQGRAPKGPPLDAQRLQASQDALDAGLSSMIVQGWGYSEQVVQAIYHHHGPVPSPGENLLTFPEADERLTYMLAAAEQLACGMDEPDGHEVEAARQLLEALDMTLTDEFLAIAQDTAESFMTEVGANKAA